MECDRALATEADGTSMEHMASCSCRHGSGGKGWGDRCIVQTGQQVEGSIEEVEGAECDVESDTVAARRRCSAGDEEKSTASMGAVADGSRAATEGRVVYATKPGWTCGGFDGEGIGVVEGTGNRGS